MRDVVSENKRVKKLVDWLIFMGYASSRKELAELMGYKDTSLSQIENGKVNVSSKFIKNLSKLDNRINESWLSSGEGEMLLDSEIMIQTNNGGNNQQGKLNQQTINSEKNLKEFIDALKGQNQITLKSMEQTSKAIESTHTALAEISKQREQIDRLISMIEKLQSSLK